MNQQLNSMHTEYHLYAHKLTQNRTLADDLVQEALTRYLHTDASAITNTQGYIKRTIHNLFINNIRTEKRQRVFAVHTARTETPSFSPVFRYETETELLQMFNVMQSVLTPHERAVFILKKGFEKEYEWIEKIFGVSYDNCRQLLHRAKTKLRRGNTATSFVSGRELYEHFLKASRNGKFNELVSFLKEDISVMN